MFRTVLLVLASVLFLASTATAGYKECTYENGKLVVSKLSGLKGMVVSHRRLDSHKKVAKNCMYDVRFVTDSGWVYTIEKMMAYEIGWPPRKPTPTVPTPTVPEAPSHPTGVEGLDFGS